MIAVIKIKMKYGGKAQNGSVVWVYNTMEEAEHKGSQISRSHLERTGYKIMRKGKEADQYVINMGFKGEKDASYLAIEKEIRPLFRERLLTELLN